VPNGRSRSAMTASRAGDRPGDVVGDDRRADPALGADHGENLADRLGVRRVEQSAYRADNVDGRDRRNQIVADAAPDQLAVEHDVVVAANDDDAGARVADIGELVEARQNAVAVIFRFENHDVRGRRCAVGLKRRRDAAHLHAQMRLGETAILGGGLHDRCGLDRLAKCLHRDAWRRRDELVGACAGDRLFRPRGLFLVPDHFPTSLILAFSTSRYRVEGSSPLR
jgi:hypothetical protein